MNELILPNKSKVKLNPKTKLIDIYNEHKSNYDGYIVAACIDNTFVELSEVYNGGTLTFVDTSAEGLNAFKIYARTLIFMISIAAQKVLGKSLLVKYGVSNGVYCVIEGLTEVTKEEIDALTKEVQSMIKSDLPITKHPIKEVDITSALESQGINLLPEELKYLDINLKHYYQLDNSKQICYGIMASKTSFVPKFNLVKFHQGFIIQHPDVKNGKEVPKFKPQLSLSSLFEETEQWAEKLEINYSNQINKHIINGTIDELIRVTEARYSKKIADVVDSIVKSRKKVILLAGPSSSGKTTTMKRIMTQLRAEGLKIKTISVDDYYKGVHLYPKGEDGKPDYEHIEALDIDLLNENITSLLAGETINVPHFNFEQGLREFSGKTMDLKYDELLFLEGIHCLNDRLTHTIPKSLKFKIYVSALTQLNIDKHTRISIADLRLIRRIVRDARTRGNEAQNTIKNWHKVRNGEYKNIYPYQEEADAMLNTSLSYEINALKKYVLPLLKEIKQSDSAYVEAQRLMALLSNFMEIENDSAVFQNSILREFIGGSCFE